MTTFEQDRTKLVGYYLDTKIVRIMKKSKVVSVNELIPYVTKQSYRFSPSTKLILERIDHLIEKEYMEYTDETKTRLIYIPWILKVKIIQTFFDKKKNYY